MVYDKANSTSVNIYPDNVAQSTFRLCYLEEDIVDLPMKMIISTVC